MSWVESKALQETLIALLNFRIASNSSLYEQTSAYPLQFSRDDLMVSNFMKSSGLADHFSYKRDEKALFVSVDYMWLGQEKGPLLLPVFLDRTMFRAFIIPTSYDPVGTVFDRIIKVNDKHLGLIKDVEVITNFMESVVYLDEEIQVSVWKEYVNLYNKQGHKDYYLCKVKNKWQTKWSPFCWQVESSDVLQTLRGRVPLYDKVSRILEELKDPDEPILIQPQSVPSMEAKEVDIQPVERFVWISTDTKARYGDPMKNNTIGDEKYLVIKGISLRLDWMCTIFYNTPLESQTRIADTLDYYDLQLIRSLLYGRVTMYHFYKSASDKLINILNKPDSFIRMYANWQVGRKIDLCFSLGLPLTQQLLHNKDMLLRASKDVDGIMLQQLLKRLNRLTK